MTRVPSSILLLLLAAIALVVLRPSPARAAEGRDLFREQRFRGRVRKSVAYPYLLHLPAGATGRSRRRYPCILFLHGAGERGEDLKALRRIGPTGPAARHVRDCIVVAPQCSHRRDWDPDALLALLDEVSRRHPVDEDRVYLTGMSMGGHGAWNLAVAAPDRFAAVVPICGWAPVYLAGRLKDLPVWAFHGAKDTVIPCFRTERMVAAIRGAGGRARLTVYPEAGHDSWTATYDDPRLYRWLFARRRGISPARRGERAGPAAARDRRRRR